MPTFCTVNRALAAFIIDGADEGFEPDRIRVQGTVTFTPVLGKGDAVTMVEDDGPITVVPHPIEARISDGQIMHRGRVGVDLLAGGAQMNPPELVWKATFANLQSGGKPFSLRPVQFVAKPGGSVDLTLVAPAANAPDGVSRGPGGAALTDLIIDGSELVVIVTDEDGERELTRLPLDDVVRAEADAAAALAAQGVKDDLAAELGDAAQSASAADESAQAAAQSASDAAGSAGAARDDAEQTADDRRQTGEDRAQVGVDRQQVAEDAGAAADSATVATSAAGAAAQSASDAGGAETAAKGHADRAEEAADSADGAAVQAVTERVNALLEGAPEAYDTLAEIADKLADQDDVAEAMLQQIGQKVDKRTTGATVVYGFGGPESGGAYRVSKTYGGDRIAQRDSLGHLDVPPAPTSNGHAASKQYVDSVVSSAESSAQAAQATADAALPADRIQVVDELPSSPAADTIYLVRE